MKLFYHILSAVTIISMVSCIGDPTDHHPSGGGSGEPKEVEIEISTANRSATRAPLDGAATETGDAKESMVNTLDILVFDNDSGEFLYHREASKLPVSMGTNLFRALLEEPEDPEDMFRVHILANSHDVVAAWLASTEESEREGMTWPQIHAVLKETNPASLVNRDEFQPLPMWGWKDDLKISTSVAPTKWGPIQLLRSVASADLYVEQNAKTSKFTLTGLFAWYAANKGYVGAIEDPVNTTPKQYLIPSDMTTSLTAIEGATQAASRMHAVGVENLIVDEGGSNEKTYKAIAYQMYLYENGFLSTADQVAGSPKRPTRLIVGGKYKISEDPLELVDAYYPIDFVWSTGPYRPLIRNWKYEFKVTSVSGRGYPTLEDAAKGAVADLDLDIISWNKDDVAVGVRGQYYVSMRSKELYLFREADEWKSVGLTYEEMDDMGSDFTMNFQDQSVENPQTDLSDTVILNNYFMVEMIQTPDGEGGGSVTFNVKAMTRMGENEPTRHQQLVVHFRELEFTIDIYQLNGDEDDWVNGGTIPSDI